MPFRVRVSVPGKLILMGEHAVVYGRPALVAAIDLRLTASLGEAPPGRVRLDLPAVSVREEISWDDILAYARAARSAWEGFRDQPDPSTFARLRGNDPAHVVKVALGEAALALGEERPEGVEVAVESAVPTGSGFGSSAATAVAVVAGYLALVRGELDLASVERLALEVERRQHGTPSGVDGATVLAGGLRWAYRTADGELATEPLAAASPLLDNLRVFHTGVPPEPTGAVVAMVRARREREPSHVEAALVRIDTATVALRNALLAPRPDPRAVTAAVSLCQAGLEELGVVPKAVRALVRQVEAQGGAAKVSGAGSVAGPGAGCLLVYHPEPERIADWPFLSGLSYYPLRLGAPGLRRESIE